MRALWVVLILVIIIGAAIAAAYFFYEKPKVEAAKAPPVFFHNISLLFRYENGTQIRTGFEVFSDGLFQSSGQTLDRDYVRIGIPVNRTIRILNKNLEGQGFYRTDVLLDREQNPRVYREEIILDPYGGLQAWHTGDLGLGPVNLHVNATGAVKNVGMCIAWSSNILYASLDYPFSPIPSRLETKVDRCYDLGFSFTPQNLTLWIPVTYRQFRLVEPDDFIKVYILDKEKTGSGEYAAENETGDDIGLKDYIYTIKP